MPRSNAYQKDAVVDLARKSTARGMIRDALARLARRDAQFKPTYGAFVSATGANVNYRVNIAY